MTIYRTELRNRTEEKRLAKGDQVVFKTADSIGEFNNLITMKIDRFVDNIKKPILVGTSGKYLYLIDLAVGTGLRICDEEAATVAISREIVVSTSAGPKKLTHTKLGFMYEATVTNVKHYIPVAQDDIIVKVIGNIKESWKVLAVGSDGALFIEEIQKDPCPAGPAKSMVLRHHDTSLMQRFPDLTWC